MVIAEALLYSLPVITTKGAPWSALNEHFCGWWIDTDLHSLVDALKEAFGMTSFELQEMGLRGRSYVQSSYTEKAVFKYAKAVYDEVKNMH